MNSSAEPLTIEFERMRPRLLALAYRMLGSVADAEDAVQDAYLRFQQAAEVASPDAWLVKATTRLCIDRLRLGQAAEASTSAPGSPSRPPTAGTGRRSDRPELAESLSMAFLVLLETLSPAERAAYLLREVFDYEFEEIAALLDKTPVNVRQIAARARKRLGREGASIPTRRPARPTTWRAGSSPPAGAGDIGAIEALLTPDVDLLLGRRREGPRRPQADPRPAAGRQPAGRGHRKRRAYCDVSLTTVNGQPGVVFSEAGKAIQITHLRRRGRARRDALQRPEPGQAAPLAPAGPRESTSRPRTNPERSKAMEAAIALREAGPGSRQGRCTASEPTSRAAGWSMACSNWSRSGPRRSTAAPSASTCTRRTPARRARRSSGSTR